MLPQQARRIQRYQAAEMILALATYHAKWMRAREAAFERWAGIDRSVAPASWLDVKPEPITLEMIREGMRRILEYRPSPPVKPWLPRHRADELIADGVSPALIREHFQIF